MKTHYSLLEIHTDGGSRGNPGPAAIGVLATHEGEKIFTLSEAIGIATNNTAEYMAVIRALENIKSNNISSDKIRFVLDSELIARQITGVYKVKLPHLLHLKQQIVSLINTLKESSLINQVVFLTVPREKNKEADSLVNEALDAL